jgi:hypothetical protein
MRWYEVEPQVWDIKIEKIGVLAGIVEASYIQFVPRPRA